MLSMQMNDNAAGLPAEPGRLILNTELFAYSYELDQSDSPLDKFKVGV